MTPHDPNAPTDPDARHVREALRHAPDADISAPAELGAAILREARAAVAPSAHPSLDRSVDTVRTAWRQAWARIWSHLARPPLAAALASLMVATTLGLLWRDGAMDDPFAEPAPSSSPTASTLPAPTQAPVPVMPPVPAAPAALPQTQGQGQGDLPAAEAGRQDGRERASPPAQVPAPPANDGGLRQENALPKNATAPATAAVTQASPSPAEAPPLATAEGRVPATAARGQSAEVSAHSAAPAPAPAPAPAQAQAQAKAQALPPSPAPDSAAAPQRDSARAPVPAAEPAPAPAARMAPPGRLAVPLSLAAPDAVDEGSPAALAVQLRQEAARWQQASDGGPTRPADEALIGWLNLLAQAGAVPNDRATVETAASTGASRVLLLLREGQWAHRFVLDRQGLRWERPAQAARTLPLSPQALRQLEARWPAERP